MMRLNLLLRPAAIRCSICATFAVALASIAAAHAQSRTPPLPPPRPASLGRAPDPPPPQPQPPAPNKADEPLDLDHPPMLPSASKKRMSECGHEWRAVKMAGKDIDIGWREFATRCLTR